MRWSILNIAHCLPVLPGAPKWPAWLDLEAFSSMMCWGRMRWERYVGVLVGSQSVEGIGARWKIRIAGVAKDFS